MKERAEPGSQMTRRDFLGSTAATVALSVVPHGMAGQASAKPNSNFNGVQIGTITYSFRSMPSTTAGDLLEFLIKCGISSVELMGEPAEQFAGAPTFQRPRRPRGARLTEKERERMRAARQARLEELRKWRLSVSMDRFEALRKKYNDAGVDIYIVKFSDIGPNMPEEEVRYCFRVAKALGARGITTEISEEKAKFLAPFAAEHKIVIGFHNHTQVSSQSWDPVFAHGEYLAMNFDVGHYVAGTNEDPIPIIEKYADAGRVLSLHVKDRKVNDGPNMPFGQGDTPVALILWLMKKKGYTFPAHIELEYPIPEGSDAVAEVKKCVEFCKDVLGA